MNEVVIVLPYAGNAVLMQLRDEKEGIDFPGCWGFFGGAIDPGETPQVAVRREVEEELELKPDIVDFLSYDRVDDLGEVIVHSFYFSLCCDPHALSINEGEDAGLFTVEEINSKRLYSRKNQRYFPVCETEFISRTATRLFTIIGV